MEGAGSSLPAGLAAPGPALANPAAWQILPALSESRALLCHSLTGGVDRPQHLLHQKNNSLGTF